jgi:hypothetical protein
LLSVTLEAPSDGIIVATGFGQLSRTHVKDAFADNIMFGITDDFDSMGGPSGATSRIAMEAPSGGYISLATPQRSFPVTAGSHTISLWAARPDSTWMTSAVSDVNLVAVFYPNP